MGILIDVFGDSVNKYGEELCGDIVQIIRKEDGVVAILADGLGCGVKANMLASLAIKMLSSMFDSGVPIEDIVDMIVDTQPAGKEPGVSYSTFTIIQILKCGMIYIAQMDNPAPIFLRHGKPVKIDMNEKIINEKTVIIGETTIKNVDTIVAFSDGVLNAGTGGSLKKAWQQENIATYMTNVYMPGISAEKTTRLLLNASNSLYNNKPGDDLSVFTFRVSNIN